MESKATGAGSSHSIKNGIPLDPNIPVQEHSFISETTITDRPLSPILSSTKLNGNFVGCRRVNSKSRVKLSSRFLQDSVKDIGKNKQDFQIKFLDTALNGFKKNKELEMKQKPECKVLYNCCAIEKATKDSEGQSAIASHKGLPDFEFKKPVSPISSVKKPKKTGNTIIQQNDVIKCNTKTFDPPSETLNIPKTVFDENIKGFQTTAGSSIHLSENVVDTLNTAIHEPEFPTRQNKCSILKKSFTSSKRKNLESDKQVTCGFSSASGKKIKVSEARLKTASKIFDDADLNSFKPDPTFTTSCDVADVPVPAQLLESTRDISKTVSSVKCNTRIISAIVADQSVHSLINKNENRVNNVTSSCIAPAHPNQDPLFLESSHGGITDSQMNFAADTAIIKMDLDYNNRQTSSKSSVKLETDGLSARGAEVKSKCNVTLTNVHTKNHESDSSFVLSPGLNNNLETTLEYEMSELEKVLKQSVVNEADKKFTKRDFTMDTQETDAYFSNFTQNIVCENATANIIQVETDNTNKTLGNEHKMISGDNSVNFDKRMQIVDLRSNSDLLCIFGPTVTFTSSSQTGSGDSTRDSEYFTGFSYAECCATREISRNCKYTIEQESVKLQMLHQEQNEYLGFRKSEQGFSKNVSNSLAQLINHVQSTINTYSRMYQEIYPAGDDTNKYITDAEHNLKFEEKATFVKFGMKSKGQTASNQIFEDCTPSIPICNYRSDGCRIGSGKAIKVSDIGLLNSKIIFKDDSELHMEESNWSKPSSIGLGGGFSTASGKSIKFSKQALRRAGALFDEGRDHLEKCEVNTKFPSNVVSFETASGKGIKISEQALRKSGALFDEDKKILESFEVNSTFPPKHAVGFETASGKGIKISEQAIRKAGVLFDEDKKILENFEVNSTFPPKHAVGFKTASGKSIKISEQALRKAGVLFDEDKKILENFEVNSTFPPKHAVGFETASGKGIKISEQALRKAGALFDEDKGILESFEVNSNFPRKHTVGLETAPGKGNKISDKALHNAGALLDEDNDIRDLNTKPTSKLIEGFETLSRDCVNVSEDAPHEFGFICSNENVNTRSSLHKNKYTSIGFATATGKAIPISEDSLRKAKTILAEENIASENETFGKLKETASEALQQIINRVEHNKRSLQKVTSSEIFNTPSMIKPKKRLGTSGCKQINIPQQKLEQAKLLFEDEPYQNKSYGNESTPIKISNANIYNSTAVKLENSTPIAQVSKPNLLVTMKITPVKSFRENLPERVLPVLLKDESDSPISICSPSDKNVANLEAGLHRKIEYLKMNVKILEGRAQAVQNQNQLAETSSADYRRQRRGVLYQKKNNQNRLSYTDFVGNKRPGVITQLETETSNAPQRIFTITPQNADKVHFNCGGKKFEQLPIYVQTEDGAIVIPNLDNYVGVSEISTAFKVMPGVEVKLIPEGWILNHYKWIVWKLASYVRNFPEEFYGMCSIENVVQQLKYRYDREIDSAERPALRRILEKDDVPQKRMVLCVSDIIKITENNYELELTDGWYSVKTVIDPPLLYQIIQSKIAIGTKLVIQSAEILNCDGSHPLEAEDTVRLRISYNSTRRAVWNAKLGYQKVALPFPIALRTVHPDGGTVSNIKVYLARVYPLCYMELAKDTKPVWRNKKAEEKRAEEWETERMKKIEQIRHKVQKEYEKELKTMNKKTSTNLKTHRIAGDLNMRSQELYEMVESSNDPEGLRDILSLSQQDSVTKYKQTIAMRRQQQMTERIGEEMNNLKYFKRDVIPVLKLLVVDTYLYSDKPTVINIWRPTEEHLHMLKEGKMFSIYNLIPKKNGSLSTNSRSKFNPEPDGSPKNTKFARQLLPISLTLEKTCKPVFKEFDTVGVVVSTSIGVHDQHIWLADFLGRLLFIKIMQGPKNCSLIERLSRGQVVAITNLVHNESQHSFGQAVGNQTTLISSYPESKLLQDNIKAFKLQLPKDLTKLLLECDKTIERCVQNVDLMRICNKSYDANSLLGSTSTIGICGEDSEDDGSITLGRITTTDIAMSLIDTQQFY